MSKMEIGDVLRFNNYSTVALGIDYAVVVDFRDCFVFLVDSVGEFHLLRDALQYTLESGKSVFYV